MKCPNCGSEEYDTNNGVNQCLECGMMFPDEDEETPQEGIQRSDGE